MKVLYISGWFPYPADNGARIRIYHLIKALSERHKVYLISLLQEDSNPQDIQHLRDICKVVSLHPQHQSRPPKIKSVSGFLSSRPRSFVERFNPSILRSVQESIWAISPDVIVASTLDVVEYIPCDHSIPIILDEHNCEYAVLKRHAGRKHNLLCRLRYELSWRKYARWESNICRKFDRVIMVSEEDKKQLKTAAPDITNISIVPNGVDTEFFTPSTWKPHHNTLIYNGALTYGANLDAIKYYVSEIYPLLKHKLPDVLLYVTGRIPGANVSDIKSCPGIFLTNYVYDIRYILYNCAACIVPLREGGGSRLKILEAMAAGLPVVSTAVGAEGIDAVNETHLLIANTPSDFANAIERLMNEPELSRTLSKNARQLVEQRYSWTNIGNIFSNIVEASARK